MSNHVVTQTPFTLEFVLFSLGVDPMGHTDAIVSNINTLLEKQSGYLSRRTFQRVDANQELLDLVAWEGLDDARVAANDLPKTPEAAPFMKLITNIELMEHYQYLRTHGRWPNAPVILELFAYQLQPDSRQENVIQAYSEAVAPLAGYRGRQIFRSTKSEVAYLEIVAWDSLEEAQAASQQLLQDQGLKNASKAFASIDISGRFFHPLPIDHD
jgi:hypothetical protein